MLITRFCNIVINIETKIYLYFSLERIIIYIFKYTSVDKLALFYID